MLFLVTTWLTVFLGVVESHVIFLLNTIVTSLLAGQVFILLIYSCFVDRFQTCVGFIITVLFTAGIVVAEAYLAHLKIWELALTGFGFFAFGCHCVFSVHKYTTKGSCYQINAENYALGATLFWLDGFGLLTSLLGCFTFCKNDDDDSD